MLAYCLKWLLSLIALQHFKALAKNSTAYQRKEHRPSVEKYIHWVTSYNVVADNKGLSSLA